MSAKLSIQKTIITILLIIVDNICIQFCQIDLSISHFGIMNHEIFGLIQRISFYLGMFCKLVMHKTKDLMKSLCSAYL